MRRPTDRPLTRTDKVFIAVMFALLAIMLALTSCQQKVDSDWIGTAFGDPIAIVTIDSCQYVVWRHTLVHKENCSNHVQSHPYVPSWPLNDLGDLTIEGGDFFTMDSIVWSDPILSLGSPEFGDAFVRDDSSCFVVNESNENVQVNCDSLRRAWERAEFVRLNSVEI